MIKNKSVYWFVTFNLMKWVLHSIHQRLVLNFLRGNIKTKNIKRTFITKFPILFDTLEMNSRSNKSVEQIAQRQTQL